MRAWRSWPVWLAVIAADADGVDDGLALVPVGESWRWHLAVAATSALPALWFAPGFDDTPWPAVRSGFAGDAYGTEATRLSIAPLPSAVCFRTTFELTEPGAVAWLVLRVDWSGGFVAYLNGTELGRRNLAGEPGTLVPFEAIPASRTKGVAEEVDSSFAIPQLRVGTNVLAIQWHLTPGAYGSGLVPELLANFTRGPFVQSTTSTSQTIVWRTPALSSTEIEFGETDQFGREFRDTNLVREHRVTLTGLAPDTEYRYRVRSSDGGREAVSPLLRFCTFSEVGPLSFVVTADIGSGDLHQFDVAGVMRAQRPDLVLISGDAVYPSFREGLADQRFFSVYRRQMAGTPFFLVAGNHEMWAADPQVFYDAFVFPTNDVAEELHALAGTGPEHYYSFDHGDAHFAGLYVPLYYRGLELRPSTAQYQWLEADLAASTKPWKFLFLHLPLMSSGLHSDDDDNLNGLRDSKELADVLLPLARQHGVQMIFSGHDHAYERFRPVQGVHCLVSGGGGGTLYGILERHPANAQFLFRWHCVQVNVSGNTLHARALNETGEQLDEMFLERVPPPARRYEAAWHTPGRAFEGADDGDGNRLGQRFDFPGEPIPTAPGEFSNLGRMRVSRDHRDLHLGLEGVMLPREGNLFLFLESPALAGVTTMAGLGNGVVDPTDQGVDGLDFLESLSFRRFRPAVGCVLGDEFADGQFRSFSRTNVVGSVAGTPLVTTNLALNIGQGVFRLDAGFSDFPGARLGQFNRSPQLEPVPGEQNADFIVVSLPLNELGLRGGEIIRLGAVVGGAEFTTDILAQARFLDRSFVGAHLEGSGLGPVVLEGLEIQIGPDLDRDDDGLTDAEEAAVRTDPGNPDSDGDGLPDGWEVQHGLNPLAGEARDGPDGDPDGDGFRNEDEWAAGTDPDDPHSALRLKVRRLADGRLEFRWPTAPPRRYRLEEASALEGPYLPALPEGVLQASAREQVSVVPSPGGVEFARWYRVVLVP